jgi:hypothetical protein
VLPPDAGSIDASVARAWHEALGAPDGREDAFLPAGGTSLTALQLVDRIAAELDVSVTVDEVLEARSWRALAALVAERLGPGLETRIES